MQPCGTCGGFGVDGAGYCTTCGTFRGTPAPPTYGTHPTSGSGFGWPDPGPGGYPPPPPPPQPNRSGSLKWVLIALSAVLALTVIAIVIVVIVKKDDTTPANLAADVDACVVGTWRETSDVSGPPDDQWTTSGVVQKFRADGTGLIDYGSGVIVRGKIGGDSAQYIYTGTVTYRYRNVNGGTEYLDVSSQGTVTVKVNGVQTSTGPLSIDDLSDLDEKYTCSGDSMTQSSTNPDNSYTIKLTRTSRTA